MNTRAKQKIKISPNCPICKRRFFDIDHAQDVCEAHEEWIVCTCLICGEHSFRSKPIKVCKRCEKQAGKDKRPAGTGFSKDRRAVLRGYGLEGWE